MTNRDVHLLSGAYSLDAVSADEAAAVEAEMTRSEQLRGEIAELTDTAVMLGLAVAEETPPPMLRARLLDAIEHLPQLPAQPRDEIDELNEPAVPTALGSVSAGAAHVAPVRRRGRMRRRPAVLLSLAAVAVLLFGGGLAVDRIVMQPQSSYSAITTASDVRSSSSAVAGGGEATVFWSKKVGETAVVLNGVRHPSGKTLQMWRLNGQAAPRSAGLYEPEDGKNYVVVQGALAAGEQLAVTVEPEGGSVSPSTVPMTLVPKTATEA